MCAGTEKQGRKREGKKAFGVQHLCFVPCEFQRNALSI